MDQIREDDGSKGQCKSAGQFTSQTREQFWALDNKHQWENSTFAIILLRKSDGPIGSFTYGVVFETETDELTYGIARLCYWSDFDRLQRDAFEQMMQSICLAGNRPFPSAQSYDSLRIFMSDLVGPKQKSTTTTTSVKTLEEVNASLKAIRKHAVKAQ